MASKQTATAILWVLIAVFLVGIFLWNVPQNRANRDTNDRVNSPETIATVNGEKITLGEIEKVFDKQFSQPDQHPTIANTLEARKSIFSDAIKTEVIKQTMKQFNLRPDDRKYAEQVAREYATLQLSDMRKQAEAEQKANQTDKKKTAADKAKTVDQIYTDSIGKFMKEQGGEKEVKNPSDSVFTDWFVKMLTVGKDPAMAERFFEHVRTRQIAEALVKKLPTDPFTPDYVQKIMTKDVHAHWIFIAAKDTTTDAMKAAEDKANKLRAQISAKPSSFEEVARKESDHPASKMDGGDLSWLTSGGATMAMLPVMTEYLAFSQKPKELGPVTQVFHLSRYNPAQNKFGYAFLRVDDIRTQLDLPKTFDFAKEQTADILRVKQRYLSEMGEAYLTYQQKMAQVLCFKPEFTAYQDDLIGHTAQAAKDYKLALDDKTLRDDVRGAISYQVLQTTHDFKERIPLLRAALPYADTMMSKLLFDLGLAYEKTGDKASAIEQYTNAHQAAPDSDQTLRDNLEAAFNRLGDKKDAAEIVEWRTTHKPAAPKTPPMGQPNFTSPPIPAGK